LARCQLYFLNLSAYFIIQSLTLTHQTFLNLLETILLSFIVICQPRLHNSFLYEHWVYFDGSISVRKVLKFKLSLSRSKINENSYFLSYNINFINFFSPICLRVDINYSKATRITTLPSVSDRTDKSSLHAILIQQRLSQSKLYNESYLRLINWQKTKSYFTTNSPIPISYNSSITKLTNNDKLPTWS
jgi:hypothetical protein